MSLDIAVVLAYVTTMLLLGWYGFGRTRNSEEFLLAGRTLGPAMYMGTLATIVLGGASTVGTVRMGYVYGISGIWLCVSFGAGLIAISLLLAKPLMNLRIYTITQVLERRYNPAARQASALIMIAYTVMVGVVSMLAAATILQVLLELPFWAALMLGAGCVIVYSVVGGMWGIRGGRGMCLGGVARALVALARSTVVARASACCASVVWCVAAALLVALINSRDLPDCHV